ncbi:MAG: hypothetical protein VB051_00270 [Candidatus Pelethousia sp.]|nr:hypothetical protein [Candidatus Pelethousia sp.]
MRRLTARVARFCFDTGLPLCLADLDVEPTPENVMIIADKMVNNNALVYAETFHITLDSVYQSILAADKLGSFY